MKFRILTLISFAFLLSAFVFVVPALAGPTVYTTNVWGKVTTSGNPVSGAVVNVTCNGNLLSDTTNASGDYAVQYTSAQCKDGDTASATATKNGQSGTDSSTVNNFGAPINLHLAVVNPVIPVPEFGFIPYGIAALGSAGAFLKLRKKV